MCDLSGFEYEIGRDENRPPRISEMWMTGATPVPRSSYRIEPAGPFWWRIYLVRQFPAQHPIESDGGPGGLVFGTYARAERKAARLLARWDEFHAQFRRDVEDGFQRGLRGGLG